MAAEDGGASRSVLAGWPTQRRFTLLRRAVRLDLSSLAGLGIIPILGRLRLPPRSLAAALIGGLIMGYGARLAFGCNIGAFFSGVASTSLHGWLWIVCGLLGTWAGVRLRPLFGFRND